MGKKLRKTIKYSLLTLLFALFFASAGVLASVWLRPESEKPVPFSQKIVLSVKDKVQHSVETGSEVEETGLNVVLQYAESFTCAHAQIDTQEELEAHRAELLAHYSVHNAEIVSELDLSDCADVSYSYYGPFIEYRYDSVQDFFANDLEVIERADSVRLEKVYVEDRDLSDDATRNSSRDNYNFNQALSDIGVTDAQYSGNGIKVGIVESGVPNNTVNLSGVTYETYGTTLTSHSFQTSSIIGANSGIAKDAEIYFAALSDYSFVSCCNWFISNGVNVINRSNGGGTGTYNSTSAYADYVVRQAKITFINSAGNDGDTNISGYPGTGLNVISVASSDWNKAISSFSSAGMQEGETISLAKPTLTAPGGSISGISNVSGAISGTSFSAPMVTGVVALLMEEFPQLKYNPQAVMALLTNTCTPVAGQTEIWDHDAGFGLINYRNARENYGKVAYYEVHDTAPAGSMVCRHYFDLPFGGTVKADLSLLVNSAQTNTSSLLPVNYTKLRLDIMDNATGYIVATGETLSNLSYIKFTNNGNSDGTFGTSFSFCVYLATAKTTSASEQYSLHYVVEGVVSSETVSVGLFCNGGYVYGNNFSSSAVINTPLVLNINDVLRIENYSTADVECNLGFDTDITIKLNRFNKGENRIVIYDNKGLQVELIFRVQVAAPKLVIDNSIYSDGATIIKGGSTLVSWSLSCDTAEANVKITSDFGYDATLQCASYPNYNLIGANGKRVIFTIVLTDDCGTQCTFTLIIDREAPEAAIYTQGAPVENYGKINTPFYVTFDMSDATAVYRLNGGAYRAYASDGVLSADGVYEFVISDSVGNETERTVYLDGTAPELNLGLSVYGETAKTHLTLPGGGWREIENYFLTGFSLGGLTDGDKLSRAEVVYDGATFVYVIGSASANFTEGGEYAVTVYDSYNNRYSFNLFVLGEEPAVEFIVENETLTLSITYDQPFEEITRLEIYRNGEILDGVSKDVTSYTFCEDGVYTLYMWDNVGRFIERVYEFVKEAPAGNILGVENGGKTKRSVSIYYDSSKFDYEIKKNGAVVSSAEVGAINLNDDGVYEVTLFYKTDAANFTVYTFEIDKCAPVLTAQGTTYGSDEVINFNSQSGLNTEEYCFKTFTVTSLTDACKLPVLEIAVDGETRRYFGGGKLPAISDGGIYTYTVYDSIGNSYSFTVRVAGETPEIDIEFNDKQTEFSVIIDLQNTFVNVVSIEILKDGEAVDGTSAGVLRYTFVGDGNYTVLVTDDAGRLTTLEYTFKKHAPQAAVGGVKQSGRTKGTVNFSYDKSVYFAEVYLNGKLISTDRPQREASDNAVDNSQSGVISLTENGIYEIRLAYITDPNNYVVYNFVIDKIAPKIELSGSVDGKTVSNNVRVSWTDTDVASAVYSLNGGKEKAFAKDSEFTEEGIYSITLKDDVDNVSKATFGIDKTAPEVSATAWVYGETEQRQLKINNDNSRKVMSLFCTRFDITEIFDELSASYIEIMFNNVLTRYASGEEVPAFTAAGVYNVLVYDRLNNIYMFTANVIGGAPQITFVQSEDETSFDISIDIDVRTDLIASIDIIKDGERIDGGSKKYNYSFVKDGEYTVIIREYFNRGAEMSFSFEKPLPEITLSGVEAGGVTNSQVEFAFGENFAVEVHKDGEQLSVNEDGTFDFTADGEYTVRVYYKSDAASYRDYSFVIDTVCPELQISGIENGGSGRTPVVISEIEEGAVLQLYKDGELIDYTAGEEISDAGTYELRLTDAAGNVSVYTFTIESAFPLKPILILGVTPMAVLVLGAIASAAVFFINKKRQH